MVTWHRECLIEGMKSEINQMKSTTVKITYGDGTPDTISTAGGAYGVIASRYGVEVSSLVTDKGEDRALVWLDEATAENDDGAKAIAEIREAK